MFGRFLALSLILLVLAVGALSGCGVLRTDTEKFDQTYTVTAGTKIDISNTDGDINVSAWDIDHAEVTATKSTSWGTAELGKVEIHVDVDTAGAMKIETKILQKNARVSVSYEIRVPRNSVLDTVTTAAGKISLDGVSGGDLTITTSNGGIYVKGGSGQITATSSNGSIELDGTSGEGTLVTSNGHILVSKTVGNIIATTSNGGIEIKDSKGDVTLDSSNGAISVTNLDGYVLRAKTSNGAIDITRTTGIIVAETSNYNVKAEVSNVRDPGTTIKTSHGSIELYLSASLNASIEMKTSSGQISLHSSPTIQTSQFEPSYLKGTLGTGGSSIYVETTNGDIDVYKLEIS
jgi:hypothetical protein